MLVGLTKSEVVRYVSDLDPAKRYDQVPVDPKKPRGELKKVEIIDWDSATVFEIGFLDVFVMSAIYDGAMTFGRDGDGNTSFGMKTNQTALDAVRFGLKGWGNFFDKDGNSIPYKTSEYDFRGRKYTVTSDESLNSLGTQLIQELATKIKAMSEVTAAEEKNSASASQH